MRERHAIAEGLDDGALMRRVAAGDARALEAVAGRYTPMLFGIAWRMLADAAEAEDVVQETITRAWVNAASWAPVGGGLGAWLRRIATNLCLDRKRRRAFVSDEDVPERVVEVSLRRLNAETRAREGGRGMHTCTCSIGSTSPPPRSSCLPTSAPSSSAASGQKWPPGRSPPLTHRSSDRQRAAIVLTYFEGVSNAEAAATLGLGVKAVESLLVRARQGLSRSLAAQGLLTEGSAA